ncbi:universal stress protein [Pseudonocardia sp.]|uniref:universal stress protein n=1 Tax=Pseudonocardia sp. TaxID=60912 RepID=UPI003D0D3540
MSPARGRAPVVVGIDAAGSAGDAVDWASAEASARGRPLHVVHAFQLPLPVDPYGVVPTTDGVLMARAAAEHALARAVARARSVASDVEVSPLLLCGPPARAVLGEATGACLVVLGRRRRSGLRALLARSLSVQVAAHACCPVVVVPPPDCADDLRWSPPRVVVGVDAAATRTPAVGFAFQAARQRGIPLVAVHAWTPDPPADLEGVSGPCALAQALARRTVERVLDRWRPEFTDVPVHTVLVRGDPARALVAQSRGAALLVVGTRGRGRVLATVLGSVSQAVQHYGDRPVAIIRYDNASTPTRPAGRVADPAPERDHGSGHRKGPSTPRNRRWTS